MAKGQQRSNREKKKPKQDKNKDKAKGTTTAWVVSNAGKPSGKK